MHGDMRSVVLALVAIVLVCAAIFIGIYAVDFMGQLPSRR
jgi:hypothetical protein